MKYPTRKPASPVEHWELGMFKADLLAKAGAAVTIVDVIELGGELIVRQIVKAGGVVYCM